MLVLNRKVGEQICMPESGIAVTVLAINGRRVRLGVTAPERISVVRLEVRERASNPGTNMVDPEADAESS